MILRKVEVVLFNSQVIKISKRRAKKLVAAGDAIYRKGK